VSRATWCYIVGVLSLTVFSYSLSLTPLSSVSLASSVVAFSFFIVYEVKK